MKNILFIRSVAGFHSLDYFESKTEALVFGDVAGYSYFVECLDFAQESKGFVDLSEIDFLSNSMRVVISPVQNVGGNDPRVRIFERPVMLQGAKNMELVICGNRSGYKLLRESFEKLIVETSADVDDHLHVDDYDQCWLIPRSVSLNIRSPLTKWSLGSLGAFEDMVVNRRDDYFPSGIDYLFMDFDGYHQVDLKMIKELLK